MSLAIQPVNEVPHKHQQLEPIFGLIIFDQIAI